MNDVSWHADCFNEFLERFTSMESCKEEMEKVNSSLEKLEGEDVGGFFIADSRVWTKEKEKDRLYRDLYFLDLVMKKHMDTRKRTLYSWLCACTDGKGAFNPDRESCTMGKGKYHTALEAALDADAHAKTHSRPVCFPLMDLDEWRNNLVSVYRHPPLRWNQNTDSRKFIFEGRPVDIISQSKETDRG